MSLSVGIVGLPNVGKSTLFNALLKRQAALAANYPFATIDPNTGIVPVPDERLSILAKIVHTETMKPATVEFVDIAGLVKGASEGAGLGNKFLSHIREVDLICHVVRAFSDSDIIREGSVDPKTDRETIEMELILADMETLAKQKEPKVSQDKDELVKWEVIQEFKSCLDEGNALNSKFQFSNSKQITNSNDQDKYYFVARDLGLLTAKPMIYVVNVDEETIGVSAQSSGVRELSDNLGVSEHQIVVVSAKIESELSSLSDEDQKLYLADLRLEQSGLERLIQKAYQMLGLQSFLTAGEMEVKAWTITKGTLAPQAAGVIHTDFAKKFIKANVVSYDDFVEFQGWKKARELGKVRMEGKDYVMQEGDVVEFAIGK